jgi:hypothetical protein
VCGGWEGWRGLSRALLDGEGGAVFVHPLIVPRQDVIDQFPQVAVPGDLPGDAADLGDRQCRQGLAAVEVAIPASVMSAGVLDEVVVLLFAEPAGVHRAFSEGGDLPCRTE